MINPMRLVRTIAVAALAGAAVTGGWGRMAVAEEINVVGGYAVHGYDVVAYFTDGVPTPGDDRYTASHDGVVWRFASAAHRDLFVADPGRYAPQYGGFCAYGAAKGRKYDGDPLVWNIVDGKLYLNYSDDAEKTWLTQRAGYIRSADRNWSLISDIPDDTLALAPPQGVIVGVQ
jgi:hypothetical protein